jgi:hypothetical protein
MIGTTRLAYVELSAIMSFALCWNEGVEQKAKGELGVRKSRVVVGFAMHVKDCTCATVGH